MIFYGKIDIFGNNPGKGAVLRENKRKAGGLGCGIHIAITEQAANPTCAPWPIRESFPHTA